MADIFWRRAKQCWILPYKAKDGKTAQKYVPREFTRTMKKQARTWAHAWLETADAMGHEPVRRTPGGGLALAAAFERFVAIKAADPDLAPSTIANYRSDFRAHILTPEGFRESERVGDRTVAELGTDYARLKAWYLAVRRRCSSASRARSVFSTMRVFFDEAVVQKWFRGMNPFRNSTMVKMLPPLPTKREKPPIVVPLEHAQALIFGRLGRRIEKQIALGLEVEAPEETEKVPVPRRVRYALAFTSGDRDGELSGLTWASLRLDDKIPAMEVERARRLIRRDDDAEELGPLKTRTSPRTMPLHPAAVDALRWWRDDSEGVSWLLGRSPEPTDPVFPSERHGGTASFARPKSAEKIREDLTALKLPTKGAKDGAITMHATRRSFLSYLERIGVEEQHRKILAGHGIADVTHRHYTAEDEARLRELAASVAKIPLRWEAPAPLSGRPDHGDGGANLVSGSMPALVSSDTRRGRGKRTLSRTAATLPESRFRDLNSRPTVYEIEAQKGPALPKSPNGQSGQSEAHEGNQSDCGQRTRRGADSASGHKKPRSLARVPRSLEAVRIESAPGVAFVREETMPGRDGGPELVADLEERVRVAVGQRGGLP